MKRMLVQSRDFGCMKQLCFFQVFTLIKYVSEYDTQAIYMRHVGPSTIVKRSFIQQVSFNGCCKLTSNSLQLLWNENKNIDDQLIISMQGTNVDSLIPVQYNDEPAYVNLLGCPVVLFDDLPDESQVSPDLLDCALYSVFPNQFEDPSRNYEN